MPKFTVDAAKDAKLQYLKDRCDKIVAVVGEPTTYANVTTTLGTGAGQKCAEVDILAADMIIEDGPTDGRQLRIVEKTGIIPVANGSPNYYAWLDTANSVVLLYSDTPAKAVTTDAEVKFGEHAYIDRDTTAVS